jgi:hypothetical protein
VRAEDQAVQRMTMSDKRQRRPAITPPGDLVDIPELPLPVGTPKSGHHSTPDTWQPPRWIQAAENHTVVLDRGKLWLTITYACRGWRIPKAVFYWAGQGLVGCCRECGYVLSGAGKVADAVYSFSAALDHENAAKAALGTAHQYRGAERHVNAKTGRRRLMVAAVAAVVLLGLWLGFYHLEAGAITGIGIAILLDALGRHRKPPKTAPPHRPRSLVEGMPVSLLRREITIFLAEEGYENSITVGDVRWALDRHEYHVDVVTYIEIEPKLLRTLEKRISAPDRAIRVVTDPHNSAVKTLMIRTGNPLANVPTLPWIPAGALSAWQPLPLGLSADPDTPYALNIAGQHISIIGVQGAGKTTVHMNNAIDRLAACRDAVQWGVTLDKPENFKAWGDVLSRTAYTVHDIDQLLDAALDELERRSGVLDELTKIARSMDDPSLRRKEWCPDLGPALFIWFDEFPQLIPWDGTKLAEDGTKPNLLLKVERLIRIGRALGISVGLAMQATGNQDSGSSVVAKLTTIKIVGPCSEADTVKVFGKDKRDAGYAPHLLVPAKLGGNHHDAGMAVIDGAGFGPDYVRGGAPFDVLARSMRREQEWAQTGNKPVLPSRASKDILDVETVPPGLAAVIQAFAHYENVDVLSSALVLSHANEHGGRWTATTLAETLVTECPTVFRPRETTRDGRCRIKRRNVKCYHLGDVEAAIRSLDKETPHAVRYRN